MGLDPIFSIENIIISLILIIGLFSLVFFYSKIITHNPLHKYLMYGLGFKILMSIAFIMIYYFFYGGGDAYWYCYNAKCLVNSFFYHPSEITKIIISGNIDPENYYRLFSINTGYPATDLLYDPKTLAVSRFAFPILFVTQNYISTTIIVSMFAFIGQWKMFTLLNKLFPKFTKYAAIAVLFFPSPTFWSSGVLKDTFIYGAALWSVYNFYQIFVYKKNILGNIFLFIMNFYIMILIKPYVAVALLPSIVLLFSLSYIRQIRNRFIRYFVAPFGLLLAFILSIVIYTSIGSSLGPYGSIQSAIDKAYVTQQDFLKNETYSAHKYDIGEFEPTIPGIISKFPKAVFFGFFGPFIWQADNLTMLLAALESLALLIIIIYLLYKIRWYFFKFIFQNDFLIFALVFSLIFIFFVGLSSANYGSLSRYRIPALPFFLSSLLAIYNYSKQQKFL